MNSATLPIVANNSKFYSTQSSFSDPGEFAHRYADLPAAPARLARIVRDLMLHRLEGGALAYAIPADRLRDDAETRYLDDILRIVLARNDAPLTQPRPAEERFIGVCRDFSLMFCSLLRHQGIPARLRIGFADYFDQDGFHGDHVVVEYWDSERGWLLADPQLTDPAIVSPTAQSFDPMDVPRTRFLTAGTAWRAIRSGTADASTFGLRRPVEPLIGEWYVAGSVRLDLAAVNKVETLLWDVWGDGAGSDDELTDATRALCDEAAAVIGDEVAFEAARALFQHNAALRTPATVVSMSAYRGVASVVLRS